MKNNSLAMIATIAAVVALATATAYIDPGACVNDPALAWGSCEAVARDKWIVFFSALSVAALSFAGYLMQRARYRKASSNKS